MSVTYKSVGWNRQKKRYDIALALVVGVALIIFALVSVTRDPHVTAETVILRATSWTAFLLLHLILCIGPLARFDKRFLPLLYNRRHAGVVMFLLALIHAGIAIFQFHALGTLNPLVSVFTAYRADFNVVSGPGGVAQFPFEPFGAIALIILLLMAATSHDFWLRNLSASIWKLLHMFVYIAYGSLVVHVAFGVVQSEPNVYFAAVTVLGLSIVVALHWLAYRKEAKLDALVTGAIQDGFARACPADRIAESHGKAVVINGERIAVFRNDGRIIAMSNECRHQGGPICEGKIIDGCVTCPWHGWQYKVEDGCSPPPFNETLQTYQTRIIDGDVFVRAKANQPGSKSAGVEALRSRDTDSSEFYIGYRSRAPIGIARFVRFVAVAVVSGIAFLALSIAVSHARSDRGYYEFGLQRQFEGVLLEDPLPMLRIGRGQDGGQCFPLVAGGKMGAGPLIAGKQGCRVRFVGSLVYRDGITMIEMNDPDSLFVETKHDALEKSGRALRLGHVTLSGELVDTKCYFGVMRPATGKVHRACAIRCLDGGVPPGLLVRSQDGASQIVLLAGEEGASLQFDVQWAALSVRATGLLEFHDGVYVLRTGALALIDDLEQGMERASGYPIARKGGI